MSERATSDKAPQTANASRFTIRVTEMLQDMLSRPPSTERLEAALRLLAKWRSQLISNTMETRGDRTILRGPFAGMVYLDQASEGARIARLLGAYEHSLSPVIEEIVAKDYEVIVDIGCAEGYYAVGLARRMPQALVMARDASKSALKLCAALAELNEVSDRIEIGGLFGHEDFHVAEQKKTVVICDIEGAEKDLLDPAMAPGLLHADILVEVHECFRQGLVDLLTRRFSSTHTVRRIDRALDGDALPAWMEGLSDLDRLIALWEWRSGSTPWLWMTRRT